MLFRSGATGPTGSGVTGPTGSGATGPTGATGAPGSASASGSTGYVQYNNGGVLGGTSNLFWDISNGRLGILTSSPSYPLHVTTAASGYCIYGKGQYGVVGKAKDGSSYGVYGEADSSSYNAYLGYANAYSVFANGNMRLENGNFGIGLGGAASYPLQVQTSSSGYCIYGRGEYGVVGKAKDQFSYGVYGEANNSAYNVYLGYRDTYAVYANGKSRFEGYLGIGVGGDPQYPLHVVAGSPYAIYATSSGSVAINGTGAGGVYGSDGSANGQLGYNDGGTHYAFYGSGKGYFSDNVGIQTKADGTIRLKVDGGNNYAIQAASNSACIIDRKSTRLNSSHTDISRMPSSA